MGEAAGRVSLAASGRSQAIEGQVSITATSVMAAYHLPPILKELREAAPGIVIEVIASNEVRDLRRREADIAIRHGRPEQPDLIAKLVHETSAHLYASHAFLERHGRPDSPEDLRDAVFIGFEQPARVLPHLTPLGLPLTEASFKLITSSGPVLLSLVRHGLGISVLTKDIAAMMPEVEQILPQLPPIPVPTWLVTHRELHTSRRIRLVYDHLAEAFARLRAGERAAARVAS